METDELRWSELECPSCKTGLAEWAERCPHCGQDLLEVYSGTFRARPKPWARVVAGAILLAILMCAVGAIALLFRR